MREQRKIGAVLSYATIITNILIQFIYTPVMLKLLGQSEYGLYTLANSTISYLSLLDLGFSGAYLRFYSRYKEKGENEKIESLNGLFLLVFLVLGLIALLCGWSLSGHIGDIMNKSLTTQEIETATILMKILSVSLFFTLLSNVSNSIMISGECFLVEKGLALLKVLFSPFIALPLMLLGYGSISIAIASLIVSVISVLYGFYYCIKKIHIKFRFYKFEKNILVQIGQFSFFILINELISQINWNVDKVLLGYFSGTAMTAMYGVGSQIDQVYRSMSTAISSVFTPKVNTLVAKGNCDKELDDLFIKIGRIQFIIIVPILIGFISFGKFFIQVWAGKDYSESYWVAVILMVSVTIPLIQNIGIEIQRAKNMHQFRSIIYLIIAVLNVIISIPLCKTWGAIGAASGTAFSLIIGNVMIMNWFYQKYIKLDIKLFWKSIFSLLKALIAPIIFCLVINKMIITWNMLIFLVMGFAFIIIYLVSMWFLGMNNFEKELFMGIINRRKIRNRQL